MVVKKILIEKSINDMNLKETFLKFPRVSTSKRKEKGKNQNLITLNKILESKILADILVFMRIWKLDLHYY